MKSIEKVRNKLYAAISSGCSKDYILTVSKHLDDLIVKQMMMDYGKYFIRASEASTS